MGNPLTLYDGRAARRRRRNHRRNCSNHRAFDAYNYEMPGTHLHKLQIGHGNCMVFSQPFMYSIAPAGSASIRL